VGSFVSKLIQHGPSGLSPDLAITCFYCHAEYRLGSEQFPSHPNPLRSLPRKNEGNLVLAERTD
jgi:hypothetical protein